MTLDFLGLFLVFAGFVVGLGAVTVIDLHGFLARTSVYWTETTIRAHKITKPLIWVGMFLVVFGGCIFYRQEPFYGIPLAQVLIFCILVCNGVFLSFVVSPYLLEKEKNHQEHILLSDVWQKKIFVSFIISFIGWWSSLVLFVVSILHR